MPSSARGLGAGLLIGAFLLVAAGCRPLALEKKWDRSRSRDLTIEAIYQEPYRYEGRVVELSGWFKGWKGGCRSGPPVSRSDWMIEDGTGCLYVSGPLPRPGLDPVDPEDERLSLTGVIKIGPLGLPYLQLLK